MIETAFRQLKSWCEERKISLNQIKENNSLYAYHVPKRNKSKAQHIGECAKQIARQNNIYSTYYSNKQGITVILSENILSDNSISGILDEVDRKNSGFFNRLDDVLATEAQFKTPSKARKKGDATNQAPSKFEDDTYNEPKTINDKIDEALDGIATPNNVQPVDGIKSLKNVLAATGLEKALKTAGVKWHVAKPGMYTITFTVNNIPVLKKDTISLADEKELSKLISELESIARGQAPEEGEMEAERAKKRQADARLIAQQSAVGGNPEQVEQT